MKTNLLNTSFLTLLLLSAACGKAPKDDGEQTVTTKNSSLPNVEENGLAKMETAIKEKNVEMFKEAVKEGQVDLGEAVVNGKDTALIAAIRAEANPIIELLLKTTVNFDESNFDGETALMVAAEKGRVDLVQQLIDKKVKLDLKDNKGNTALHRAIRGKRENIALLLIKSGANTEITDASDMNAFRLAEKFGLEEVKTLLVNKIKVEVGTPTLADFRTIIVALDNAALKKMLAKYPSIAKDHEASNPLLLLASADKSKSNSAQQVASTLLNITDYPINVNGVEGELAPLIQAVIKQKYGFVDMLLDYHAKPQVFDGEGFSPLMHAVGYNDLKLVESLLEHKAPVQYKTKVRGKKKSFEACDVARAKGKTYKKGSEDKKINDEIKEKLDCGWIDLFD